ncbi:MAG: S8 family serine peptidase [Bacteroidota bacterium]
MNQPKVLFLKNTLPCLTKCIGITSILLVFFSSILTAQLDTIISPSFRYGCKGEGITLTLPDSLSDANFQFEWELEGEIAAPPTNNLIYEINALDSNSTGNYFCKINRNIDSIYYGPITVQTFLEDSLGGKYFPDQVIIQFNSGVTLAEIDSLRDTFQAVQLKECICDTLVLWQLNLPITIDGVPIINIEDAVGSLMSRPATKSVERNYLITENSTSKNQVSRKTGRDSYVKEDRIASSNSLLPPIKVAIIDNGINEAHPNLAAKIRTNPSEQISDEVFIDDDDNCEVDDISGYDYVEDNNTPDVNFFSHGTKVALIIDSVFQQFGNTSGYRLEIINVRSLDDDGLGSLFDLICGTYYAHVENADLVNMSLGYQSAYRSEIFEDIISVGTDKCQTLFIASAGNERENNRLVPHYPSNFNDLNERLIAVAAVDSMFRGDVFTNSSSQYTNYDSSSIDVIAKGYWRLASANNVSSIEEGTSMSAAFVTGILAALKSHRFDASGLQLKDFLLSNSLTQKNQQLDTISKMGLTINNDELTKVILIANQDLPQVCNIIVNDKEEISEVLPINSFPNPFHDGVNFQFTLKRRSQIQIRLVNSVGQMIFQTKENYPAGQQAYYWNSTAHPVPLSKGVYFYSISINGVMHTGKLIYH